jgi:hypothetical protein
MAFKYKLKEVSPTDIKKAAGTVGPDVMKGVTAKHLNGKDFEDLEQILGQAGLEQNKIDKILDMWAERPMFINPNESKEDPIQTFLDKKLAKWNSENPNYDPNAKNTFNKDEVKEAVLKHLKENKPCWSGYKQAGMKEKNGKSVPNCVPNK